MTRLEKCELAYKLGFTYNELSGDVITPTAKILKKTTSNGYLMLTLRNETKKAYYLYAHHYAWYYKYGDVVPIIDHKDRNRKNNSIYNLRPVTKQINALNTKSKGVSFDKSGNKWVSKIELNGKSKIIGRFESEKEAIKSYQEYKEKVIKELIIKNKLK